MALSEAEKQRRKTEEVRAKRLEWQKAYNQRPEVKARDAERARKKRETEEGRKLNYQQVEANREKLGRAYITALITKRTDIPCSAIPEQLVEFKREALILRRMARILKEATHENQQDS
jgi:uncharacterized protein YaiL (DUF2058 family)